MYDDILDKFNWDICGMCYHLGTFALKFNLWA